MGEPAVPALVELLKSDSRSVSSDASNALYALGPRAAAAIPALMEMLSRRESEQRGSAIMILGAIGPQASVAVPALVQALRDPNPNIARIAAESLGKMGPAGHAALDRNARSADAVMRQGAMAGLAAAPRTPAETRQYLETALSDNDPVVRARGVELLAADREALEESSDLLVRAMNDPAVVVSDAARRVFLSHGQRGGASAQMLTAVMLGGDVSSRADAAWRLGHLLQDKTERDGTPAGPDVRAGIEKALKDPDSKVRVYAARAMAAGYPDSHARVASILRREIPNTDVAVAVRGAGVLWRLSHQLKDVESAFNAGLSASNHWVRMETMSELIKLGRAAEPLVPAVERLLDDPVPDVRERAKRTIAYVTGTQRSP